MFPGKKHSWIGRLILLLLHIPHHIPKGVLRNHSPQPNHLLRVREKREPTHTPIDTPKSYTVPPYP